MNKFDEKMDKFDEKMDKMTKQVNELIKFRKWPYKVNKKMLNIVVYFSYTIAGKREAIGSGFLYANKIKNPNKFRIVSA